MRSGTGWVKSMQDEAVGRRGIIRHSDRDVSAGCTKPGVVGEDGHGVLVVFNQSERNDQIVAPCQIGVTHVSIMDCCFDSTPSKVPSCGFVAGPRIVNAVDAVLRTGCVQPFELVAGSAANLKNISAWFVNESNESPQQRRVITAHKLAPPLPNS
jgi:hypothetical protein